MKRPPSTLSDINARLNRAIRYTPDAADRWQTPVETLSRGEGDCEDYAIAKMSALLSEGWPVDDLRLVYCKRVLGRTSEAHMVLEARQDGVAWVLDNLGSLVSEWDQRPDLYPLFSFNARHFWVRGRLTDVDPRQRLGQWRRMLERAEKQGVHFTGDSP